MKKIQYKDKKYLKINKLAYNNLEKFVKLAIIYIL